MVILNTAEAELDETLGELIVKSRHRLENGQMTAIQKSGSKDNPKSPKIVGAVSILLIQSDCMLVTDKDSNTPVQLDKDEKEVDKNEKMETANMLTEEITSKISMCLPASLSILPLPGISNIYNTCDNQNLINRPKEQPFRMGNIENNQNNTEGNVQDLNETQENEKESVRPSSGSDIENSSGKEGYSEGTSVESRESDLAREESQAEVNTSDESEFVSTPPQTDGMQDNFQVLETTGQEGRNLQNNDTDGLCLNRECVSEDSQGRCCAFCGKAVPTFESIVQHALEDHQTSDVANTITCPLCSKNFNKLCMHDFLQHIRVHLKPENRVETEEENLKGKTTVIDFSNIDLNNYASKQNNDDQTAFYSSQSMERPNAAVLEDSLKIFESTSERLEKEHNPSLECDLSEIDPQVEGKVFCAICGQAVKGYREIINHNKLHGNSNQCPICEKQFSMRGSLLRHCFSHTQNKMFSCHICTAVFTRKDNLKRHIHKHELYGPIINKQNRPKFVPNQGNIFKMKEKKNKVLKMNFALPRQDRFTSFKRNKVFFKKLSSPLNKTNRIWKNNLGIQRIAATNSISTLQGQHEMTGSLVEDREMMPTQADGFISEQSNENNTSMYLVDSCVQIIRNEDDKRNTEERPTKQSSLAETSSILNYSCSMCSISFTKLSSLKRHVIACHSEQSFEPSEGDYHHDQSTSQSCNQLSQQMDQLNASTQEEFRRIQPDSFYNGQDKACPIASFTPTDTTRFGYNNTGKMNNPDKISSDTSIKFELLDQEVIDIESLGRLPQFTPDRQIKEEITDDKQSFSQGYDGLELSTDEALNQAIQSHFPGFPSTSGSSAGYSQGADHPMKSPLIKVPSLVGRSNQNRRHRMLNSKLPICYFCGIYLETGAQIVKHGDEHQDQFENSCTCTICLQVLCGRDSLHRHAHSHIGTTFDCDFCNASFSRKDNLKRHLKKVHSIETTPSKNPFTGIRN